MSKPESPRLSTEISPGGCLVRLAWMFLGNVVLLALAVSIARQETLLSVTDAIFWGAVIGLVWVRYIDVARLGGQTAFGEPATLDHWRRYVRVLVVFSSVLWIVAHTIAWKGAGG